MANNTDITRLDMAQIWKRMFHKNYDALRVVQVNDSEIQISLKAEDGDSVISKASSKVLEAGKEHDCSDLKRVQAFCTATVTLYGPGTMTIEKSLNPGDLLEICALKIKCDVDLVGQ
jgi:hypothetical protein